MAKVDVIITGDKEINAKLALLQGPEAKKVIRKAAREALRPVLAKARAFAPKRTGALKKSIKIRAMKRSRTRIGAIVGTAAKSFTGKQFYGSFVEFGAKPHVIRPKRKKALVGTVSFAGDKFLRRLGADNQVAVTLYGGKVNHPGVKGQHFLKRAADQGKSEAIAIYRRVTGEGIEKLVAK